MHGSGKTTMCKNFKAHFIEMVEMDKEILERLSANYKDKQDFGTDLNLILNSEIILIPLNEYQPYFWCDMSNINRMIQKLNLIIIDVLVNYFGNDKEDKTYFATRSIKTAIEENVKYFIDKYKKHFCFIWDEIDCLEYESSEITRSKQNLEDTFYTFWLVIKNLTQTKHLQHICGRNTILFTMGNDFNKRSPQGHSTQLIFLNPLEKRNILNY